MLDKVLVPLDGSPLATCVFPHLVAITRATEAHITLLRVTEKQNQASGQVNPVDWQLGKVEAQMYLDEVGERLRQFVSQTPESQVLEGPSAERIIEYAQKNDHDLVVLSTHGQGGLNGWTISSVAQKVIHRAGKSILLVPAYNAATCGQEGNWDDIHYRRIMVPLDGSQRAESVLPVATALAQQHGAELILVHVVARPEMIQRMPLTAEDNALSDQVVERNQIQAQRYFEQLQNRLSPTPQTRVVVNGQVAAALHKFVEQEQIDLVLLCAHGNSGQNQWPYGSVVTSFITYGATPLLIMQDLPAHEIEPTRAERATNASQRVWRKQTGVNGSYGIREQNGIDSHAEIINSFSNLKAERVSNYAYTALL